MNIRTLRQRSGTRSLGCLLIPRGLPRHARFHSTLTHVQNTMLMFPIRSCIKSAIFPDLSNFRAIRFCLFLFSKRDGWKNLKASRHALLARPPSYTYFHKRSEHYSICVRWDLSAPKVHCSHRSDNSFFDFSVLTVHCSHAFLVAYCQALLALEFLSNYLVIISRAYSPLLWNHASSLV